MLGSECFHLLKNRDAEPGKIVEKVKSNVGDMLEGFSSAVDTIMAAGFDPLTWEWKGEGVKPDSKVYVNMLPGYTSTLFRDWLTEYVKDKNDCSCRLDRPTPG